MRTTWQSPQAITDTNLDAYADWIGEVGPATETGYWTPWIIRVELYSGGPGDLLKVMDERITNDDFPNVAFNYHDLVYWAFTALQNIDRSAELIILHMTDSGANPRFEVERFISVLNDAGGGAANLSISGQGATLPTTVSDAVGFASVFLLAGREAEVLSQPFDPLSSEGDSASPIVITAIIDHAIPYLHPRQTNAAHDTRFAAFWQQGAEVPSHDVLVNRGGLDLTDPVLGHKLHQHTLQSALQKVKADPYLTDSSVYSHETLKPTKTPQPGFGASPLPRRRGDSPLALRASHGAQTLDLATGDAPNGALAERNPILAVELPPQLVAQTNGFLQEPYVKSALNWIWYEAMTQPALNPGGARSVVVNYSFGDHAGRRDGQAELDADFQRRIATREIDIISVPAGNSYLLDAHAAIKIDSSSGPQELEFWLQPDTRTPSFIQIWLDVAHTSLPFEFQVQAPNGAINPAVEPDSKSDLNAVDAVARIYVQNKTPTHALPNNLTPTARTCLTVAFRPTASLDPKDPVAMAGRWRLRFTPNTKTVGMTENLDVWIERNDTIEGFPRSGRQGYFTHPDHTRFLPVSGRLDQGLTTGGPIERKGTLAANANAADVFVAAAVRTSQGKFEPADYTAAATATAFAPVTGLVVEDSDAFRNVLSAGTAPGAVSFARGTSAAAALATRTAVVLLLRNDAWIGTPDARNNVKQAIITTSRRAPPPAGAGLRIGAGTSREVDDARRLKLS